MSEAVREEEAASDLGSPRRIEAKIGRIGVGDDGLGLRWFESLIAVLLPGPAESPADRPWQHALSCRKAHHNHDEPKVDGKRQHKEYGIGPIPIGDGAVFKIPVQRSHRCA